MKSALLPLQKAIYDRLKDTLTCSVYDHVPDGATMPYVTLGEDTAVDWSTKLELGMEVTHTLHVWSNYNGMAEAKQIIDQVVQALTGSSLAIEGFAVVMATLDMIDTLRDPEGYRHGVIRFRFKIMEVF